MLNIGCHLSASKGYPHMGQEALRIGANTFQFFTRNPRGSKAKKLDQKDVDALLDLTAANGFVPLLAHAPYTLNPCSADQKVRDFADMILADDIVIMENLPHNYYTFHPGSHVGQGIEAGLELITDLLNKILRPEQTTTVLLEAMSGKGSEVGSTFEELAHILQNVELADKMGICLDTCHIYAAGYDIVDDLDGVLQQFDSIIGLDKLKAVHLNDSMTPFAAHKDRHARIGEGALGLQAITRFINHPLLRHPPFYLETPNDVKGYAQEIKMLRSAYRE